jgi:hypothetical protein
MTCRFSRCRRMATNRDSKCYRLDFEVLSGDDAIATVQSIIDDPKALWPRIVELAKAHALGCRIRVTDQSDAMVALVGVATALRLGSAVLGGSN